MDAESAKERLENHWWAELEAAKVRYSDSPSGETKATYLGVLKTFAELVLRGKAPEGSDGAQAVNGLPTLR